MGEICIKGFKFEGTEVYKSKPNGLLSEGETALSEVLVNWLNSVKGESL